MGQKFEKRKTYNLEEEGGTDVDDVDGTVDTQSEESKVEEKGEKPYDNNWSITFEQFLASILTEPALVDHFSEKVDLKVSSDHCLGAYIQFESFNFRML